jgi:tetratricopeptide (TPR) repeat protein
VKEYIMHYEKTWDKLMEYQDRYPLQEYAERSVLTTWKMSYEQVRMVKPEAARLLDQWAFLHLGDMSYELLENYTRSSEGSEEARGCESIAGDELSFKDSVGVLVQYSLVNQSEGTGSFSIHAVVHDWSLYNIVDDQTKEQLCVRAIRIVAESIPPTKGAGDMRAARKLLPHARMAATRHVKMREVANLELKLHQVAYFMQDWESSQEVEGLYVRALRGYEEAWGAKHTSTLSTVNNFGALYRKQGKMKEAEEMYLRALRGYEEAWGAKHMSTLDTVYDLGNLYRDQGEVAKARDMYERAAEGYEDVEVDREAHIAYIREQLSLLVATDGEADRGCQAVSRQPLMSPAGIPLRASVVPAGDLADARSTAGEAPVRHRKRDFLLRALKR